MNCNFLAKNRTNKTLKCIFSFTLAEVLITLVIIGIIAAITVPTIMANATKRETIAKLKKNYSILQQATHLSQIDYGPSRYWYNDVERNSTKFFNTYYKQHLQIGQKCSDYTSCGYNERYPWKKGDGSTYMNAMIEEDDTRYYTFLNDGTFLYIATLASVVPNFIIDINGTKKPNVLGRDVFVMKIDNTPKGIEAHCQSVSYEEIYGNGANCGTCCLRRIINDNWEIKY